jgi:hypothetical protein
MPVTANAGSMVIRDGAMLPLSGTIENTGRSAASTTPLGFYTIAYGGHASRQSRLAADGRPRLYR